jgi:hypothetical protein
MAALAARTRRARAHAASKPSGRAAARRPRQVAAPADSALGPVQTKLRVNEPQDPFEREADRTADRVMGMREPAAAPLQRAMKEEDEGPVQRAMKEEEEEAPMPRAETEEEEEPMQARARSSRRPRLTPQFESDLKALRRKGGEPLPDPVRSFLEPRFGHSFSDVRVHVGPDASALAEDANARAFTVGRHIVFGPGEYHPSAEQGVRLIAHELTHVMQQRGGLHSVQREIGRAAAVAVAARGGVPTLEELREAFDLDSALTPPSVLSIATDLLRAVLQSESDAVRLRPFLVHDGTATGVVRRIESASYTLELAARRTAGGIERQWSLTNRAMRHTFASRPRSTSGEWPATEGSDALTITVPSRPASEQFSEQTIGAGLAEARVPEPERGVRPTPPVATITPEGTVPERAPAVPAPSASPVEAGPPARTGRASPTPAEPVGLTKPVPEPAPAAAAAGEAPAEEAPEANAEEPEHAPTDPKEDLAFQQTMGQVRSTRRAQADHRTPDEKKTEMKDAAVLPEEQQQEAHDRRAHLDDIDEESEETKTRHFTPDTFKKALAASLAEIEQNLPKDEDDAAAFKRDKRLDKVKEGVHQQVNEQNEEIAGPLAAEVRAAQAPRSETDLQTPADLVEQPPGTPPRPIAARAAAPKPKFDSEISFDAESQSLDELMATHNMTEEQLAESNEPTFIAALDTKREAQAQAAAAPGRYREQEAPVLAAAQGKAAGSGAAKFGSMHATRSGAFKSVFDTQDVTAAKDKLEQQAIHTRFAEIYGKTKEDVDGILNELTGWVDDLFSTTVEDAKKDFESRVEDQLDDIYGITVIDDWIFGEDTEAIEDVFRREKELFVQTVNNVLDLIAIKIADELNRAIKRIDDGRADGQRFYDGLSECQQKLATSAFDTFKSQFDVLEDSVRDKQQELADTLAASYKESVDSLRESFDKIKEDVSKGWIGKAVDFIVSVATTIYKLAKLLWSILTRIANVIGDILAHPIRFLENLAAGVSKGFGEFIAKIDEYLLAGFFDWLRGSVGGPGIRLPEKFDAAGIFGLVADVLGLSVETFLNVARKVWGKKPVEFLEKGMGVAEKGLEIFFIVKEKGLGGLWDHIKTVVATRVDEIVTKVKEMIVFETIKKALAYIASLFIPAGAFIKAAQAIYAGLRFLMDNIDRIAEVVDAFLSSVELAVQGKVDAIAKLIVKALRGVVVLAIDFLAKLLRLGKLDDKARKILGAIRKPVERAMAAVLRPLRPHVLRLVNGAKAKKKQMQKRAGGRQLTSRELVPQVVKLMSTPTKATAPGAALVEKKAQAKALVKKFQPRLMKGKLKIVITDPNAAEVTKDNAVDFDVSASPGSKGEAPVPAGDGKVAGLLELKREFKAEGEPHSISVAAQGKGVTAVIAPTPVQMGKWINTRREELETAKDFDAAKQAADTAIRRDLQALGQLTYSPDTAPTDEQERTANKLLDSLVAQAKIVGFTATALPVPDMIVTPGFSGQKAADTTVKYLFNDPANHRPGKGTSGREKLGGAYEVLESFGIARDFWPAAHMLHSKFGGLPLNSNLIPMPESVNRQQIAFDDKVENELYAPKKPVWMHFTVRRDHAQDKDKLFVSYFKAEAAEMPLQGDKYDVPAAGTIRFEKGSDAMVYPSAEPPQVAEGEPTLNGLITKGKATQDETRKVARATQVPHTVVEALIAKRNGQILSDVEEIGDFIRANVAEFGELSAKRYLARFEKVKRRVRL